jgi:hypothetical protein
LWLKKRWFMVDTTFVSGWILCIMVDITDINELDNYRIHVSFSSNKHNWGGPSCRRMIPCLAKFFFQLDEDRKTVMVGVVRSHSNAPGYFQGKSVRLHMKGMENCNVNHFLIWVWINTY